MDASKKLREEAAGYRKSRNSALREAAGLRAILNAHGIDPQDALDRADLSAVVINNGEAQGQVTYKAPSFTPASNGSPGRPTSGATSEAGLTRDDIRGMSRAQVHQRFDEVMAALRA